ncbi:MAG: pyrroline-5-carboxylate reductase [Methylophilales bacterium]|nr:pyrroline-5-carboxylate reductase [Methylophilales bacterium]
MKISFIGGGNMARALIIGLLDKDVAPANIGVVELDAAKRQQLGQEFGITTSAQLAMAADAEIIVLAIKPQQMRDVAIFLSSLLRNQLIVSIAAGIRTVDLIRWLGGYGAVVRVMPNTPAQVQMGVSALYATPATTQQQRQQAADLLMAVGTCVWLESEDQMDAVTAISGSGPAYMFYFLEAMQQAGSELGLQAEQVRILALQTMQGAAKLAAGSQEEFATLRAQVTSKGGTTEQAILSMEGAAIKQNIVRAIHAAAARSAELGDILGKD